MMGTSMPPLDVVALVRRHQAGVWRYLRVLGCGAAEAEELTQDTFVAVLERPFAAPNERAAGGYLRAVARNLLLKRRRAVGRTVPLDLDSVDAAMARAAGDDGGEAYVAALRECVGELDTRARELLDRAYGDGASRQALAVVFALSEDGVKSWLRRTRASLRACVEGKVRG